MEVGELYRQHFPSYPDCFSKVAGQGAFLGKIDTSLLVVTNTLVCCDHLHEWTYFYICHATVIACYVTEACYSKIES